MKTYIEILNEAEDNEKENENKHGKELAEMLLIWIIQQCLMYAFQCEFVANAGQKTFNIQNDDKTKEKFNRLVTILDAVDCEENSDLKPVVDGSGDGGCETNARFAKLIIDACPKEHGDEAKEILMALKDYLDGQVTAFKLN